MMKFVRVLKKHDMSYFTSGTIKNAVYDTKMI